MITGSISLITSSDNIKHEDINQSTSIVGDSPRVNMEISCGDINKMPATENKFSHLDNSCSNADLNATSCDITNEVMDSFVNSNDESFCRSNNQLNRLNETSNTVISAADNITIDSNVEYKFKVPPDLNFDPTSHDDVKLPAVIVEKTSADKPICNGDLGNNYTPNHSDEDGNSISATPLSNLMPNSTVTEESGIISSSSSEITLKDVKLNDSDDISTTAINYSSTDDIQQDEETKNANSTDVTSVTESQFQTELLSADANKAMTNSSVMKSVLETRLKTDLHSTDELSNTHLIKSSTDTQLRGSSFQSSGMRHSIISGDLAMFQDDEIVLSVLTQSDDEADNAEDVLKVEVRSRASDGNLQHSAILHSTPSGITCLPGGASVQPEITSGTEVLSLDSAGFEEISLQSSGAAEKSFSGSTGDNNELSDDVSESDKQNNATGLSRFFKRNLFTRRASAATQEEKSADSTDTMDQEPEPALGWKLFGKVPPKQTPQKLPSEIQSEYKARNKQKVAEEVKVRTDREVPSTTALILQPRPSDLPAKDPEEEQRHHMLYDKMVDCARRKEQKEVKLRKKKREQQIKHEELLSAAVKIWNNEILPNWETARHSKRTLELWWNGVPPSVRGKVWKLAIGNDLNITADLYEICVMRAKERLKILKDMPASSSDSDSTSSNNEPSGNRESSVELISLDVSRTFPQLCIFQKKGPYHELLQCLLSAYVCYRPDVGYVQGMSFLAAILLLNMEVTDTFICFANLLNKPSNVTFFSLDETNMKAYFSTYQMLLKENLPRLYKHFTGLHLTPDLYIIDWMYTMFAKSLPLDVTSRVWDVFFRDGEEFLFRTALGILRMYEVVLLRLDFIHLAQFLTRLPENIEADELFKNIASIRMTVDKVKYDQVFAKNKERCAAAAALSSSSPNSSMANLNRNNSTARFPTNPKSEAALSNKTVSNASASYVEFPLLASAAVVNDPSLTNSNSSTIGESFMLTIPAGSRSDDTQSSKSVSSSVSCSSGNQMAPVSVTSGMVVTNDACVAIVTSPAMSLFIETDNSQASSISNEKST